jgi:hypothetical protein
MQQFVYKKMSKLIENSVEFVDVSPKKRNQPPVSPSIVKLLRDTEPINLDAENEVYPTLHQVKPIIRKRQLEPDHLDENTKIQLTAVDGQSILQQKEVQKWKVRPAKDNKEFRYREKNGTKYQIEPENEFTKGRKKNNWSENKIMKYKHKY